MARRFRLNDEATLLGSLQANFGQPTTSATSLSTLARGSVLGNRPSRRERTSLRFVVKQTAKTIDATTA
ncbi:MAG: hypothetical protein MZU97_26570 [Bacillus subtilis]|nr:hypothetical protein [Bacillus subtilis]